MEPDSYQKYADQLALMHRQGSTFARRLAYVSAVVFVLLSILTGWALYGRFEQTNTIRHQSAGVWHAVICGIEAEVARSPDVTPARKVEAYRFYDTLLVRDVHTTACGLVHQPRR